MNYDITKELLELCINNNFTIFEIAEKIGCSKTTVRHHLLKHGLRTVHHGGGRKSIRELSKKQRFCANCGNPINSNKYCNIKCQSEKQFSDYILKWKNGDVNGLKPSCYSVSGFIRTYLWEKYNGKCCKCGWNKSNPITGTPFLEINHIDGDSSNNNEDNLELICPNCHSLTPNFRSLNKGNGKRKKGKIVL